MSIAQSEAYEERKLPVIDVSGLHGAAIDRVAVARELRLACTNTGFFYITEHGTWATRSELALSRGRRTTGQWPGQSIIIAAENEAVALEEVRARMAPTCTRAEVTQVDPDLKEPVECAFPGTRVS